MLFHILSSGTMLYAISRLHICYILNGEESLTSPSYEVACHPGIMASVVAPASKDSAQLRQEGKSAKEVPTQALDNGEAPFRQAGPSHKRKVERNEDSNRRRKKPNAELMPKKMQAEEEEEEEKEEDRRKEAVKGLNPDGGPGGSLSMYGVGVSIKAGEGWTTVRSRRQRPATLDESCCKKVCIFRADEAVTAATPKATETKAPATVTEIATHVAIEVDEPGQAGNAHEAERKAREHEDAVHAVAPQIENTTAQAEETTHVTTTAQKDKEKATARANEATPQQYCFSAFPIPDSITALPSRQSRMIVCCVCIWGHHQCHASIIITCVWAHHQCHASIIITCVWAHHQCHASIIITCVWAHHQCHASIIIT